MLVQGCLKAVASGFLISAPLGPVAFIILRQALKNHLPIALCAGLGASLADLCWGFSALLGVQWSEWFLSTYQEEFRIGGGFFLMVVGGFLLYSPPQPSSRISGDRALWIFFLSLSLTLLNPLNFTACIALFSIFHLNPPPTDFFAIGLWSMGIFCGAILWWFGLSFCVFWGRRRFDIIDVLRINRGISWVLILLGLYALLTPGIFSLLSPRG